jgi:glutamate/tyrosine decarboxylase-like PLP-dependent enzyme
MNSLQDRMFSELRDKTVFDNAQQYGYQYLDGAFDRNVYPTQEAIDGLEIFDEAMPNQTADANETLALLNKYGSPATVAQIGGRYFGFVCGSALPVGLAAKSLATFWDQNTAMYVLSPLAAKLETVVEGWLKSLFNFPDRVVAGFVSGTSSANLCGLAAARYRLLKNQNWDINENGFLNAPSIRVLAGKEAHSTIIKTIGLLGFGYKTIEFIDTDEQGRIIHELLPELDNKTLLILQAGNVNSGSFDNFSQIWRKAQAAGAWVHIDGAFGLWAAAAKKTNQLTNGIEFANSWAVDGHKTLNTPYDCGIVMCSDKEALTGALHTAGGYLMISDDRDGMFYTPEMSRRARIIELWSTLKYLGREGLDQMITGMHERAVQFANEINTVKGFTVLNEVVFNQVLVCCASDDITVKVVQQIQELRECWVGGSAWQGKKVIRISVCSWATTKEDISRSVKSFEKALGIIQKPVTA